MTLREAINKFSGIARNAPAIMRRAHKEAFAKLQTALPQVAVEALMPNIAEEDKPLAGRFLATFKALNQDPRMKFSVSRPLVSGAGEGISAEDIEKWVRAGVTNRSTDNRFGKVLDQLVDRDIEQVIRKMQGILIFADPDKLRPADESGQHNQSQLDAQAKFLPLIADFLNGGMPPEKLARWGNIVLAAWVAYVRAEWPQILIKHVRAAFT
jgi:hypothetical protein